MRHLVAKGILLAMLGSLAACSQSADSVTSHTRSYVFKAKDDFDPNYSTQISGTIKLMKPVFQSYYQQGEEDRRAGITREQAQKKADSLDRDESIQNMETHQIFINRSYSGTLDKKKQLLFIKEAKATYLDGFNGVK